MDQFTIDNHLASDIKQLIQSAKQSAAVAVNAQLTLLYWQVGTRLSQALLKGERADYGKQVVAQLAKSLTSQFGKGWSPQQLRHCIKFADVFSDKQILSAARRQLSWTHYKAIIYLDNPLKREFYTTMAMQEHWSTRTLRIRHEIKSETDWSLYPISALGKVLCRLTTRRFPCLELE